MSGGIGSFAIGVSAIGGGAPNGTGSTTIAMIGEQVLRRLGVAVVPVAERLTLLTTTVSITDLATRALTALAVIASDETPSSPDLTLAISRVEAVHDAMVAQAFVPWDGGSIPQAVSEEYVMLTALHLASAFGKTGDPAQQPVLEARVRKVAMIMRAPDEAADIVQGVHDDLAMRGKVRWSVFDIPNAVADAYVYLGAYTMAPLYGLEQNKSYTIEAEQQIARYISLPSSGERTPAEYF